MLDLQAMTGDTSHCLPLLPLLLLPQVPDLRAMTGDASDCLPGVRGIGGKTAAALLHE